MEDLQEVPIVSHDPLNPNRTIEVVRTKVTLVERCCACLSAPGLLACSQCWAVRYCGRKCQRAGWTDHKKTCNIIKRLREEVLTAGEDLAGHEAFNSLPIVRSGRFKHLHRNGRQAGDPNPGGSLSYGA